jgi:hypothetical protein
VAVQADDEGGTTVACSLDPDVLDERRVRWQALWACGAVDTVATEKGLRLIFQAGDGVEQELFRLAALERECCSFADWTVTAGEEGIVLEISAQDAVAVAAVHGMFRGLRRGDGPDGAGAGSAAPSAAEKAV